MNDIYGTKKGDVHITDTFRGLLLGIPTILPLRTEVALLVAFMGVMVPAGYVVFTLVERRCRMLGTLGLH